MIIYFAKAGIIAAAIAGVIAIAGATIHGIVLHRKRTQDQHIKPNP